MSLEDIETPHKDYPLKQRNATLISDMMDETETKRKCIQSQGRRDTYNYTGNTGSYGTSAKNIAHSTDAKYYNTGSYLKIPLSYIDDDQAIQTEKYEEYVEHAFLPEYIVSDALEEMVGICFKTAPNIKLPEKIAHLEMHANNKGDSLLAVTEQVLRDVVETGGAAISSDFMDDRSVLKHHENKYLINWRETSNGYTMMVFSETYTDDDGEAQEQRRHYSVETGELVVTLYRQINNGGWQIHEELDENENVKPPPMLPGNQKYEYIPVRIAKTKKPVLLAVAKAVLKGFRISADHFGMLHTLTPTLVIKSDKTAEKLKTGFKSGIKVGEKDAVELLQPGVDGAAPLEAAMDKLFNAAVDLGVRLITSGFASESGEALFLRNANKQIKIDAIANIVSREMTEALRVCALLERANPNEVEFSLNAELIEAPVDINQLKEMRESVLDSGLIKWSDYLRKMAASKLITLKKDAGGEYDTDLYIKEVEEERKVLMAREESGEPDEDVVIPDDQI